MARRDDSSSVGPWFRVGTDILSDARFRRLVKRNKADGFRYLELVALAKLSVDHTRSDAEVGLLLAGRGDPMKVEDISREMEETTRSIVAFISRLEEAMPGALVLENGAYRLANYVKRQYDRALDLPHERRKREGRYRDGSSDGPGDGKGDRKRDARGDASGDPSRGRARPEAEAEAVPDTETGNGRTPLPPLDSLEITELYSRYQEEFGKAPFTDLLGHDGKLRLILRQFAPDDVRAAFATYLANPFHRKRGCPITDFLTERVLTECLNGEAGREAAEPEHIPDDEGIGPKDPREVAR